MLTFLILWLLTGFCISVLVFYVNGKITVSDLIFASIMSFIGPANLMGFVIYACKEDKVIWERKK